MDSVQCNILINKFCSYISINATRSSNRTVLWGLTSSTGQAKLTNHAFHSCLLQDSYLGKQTDHHLRHEGSFHNRQELFMVCRPTLGPHRHCTNFTI